MLIKIILILYEYYLLIFVKLVFNIRFGDKFFKLFINIG